MISPFNMLEIALVGDRTLGQLYPDINGNRIQIEQCDQPCTIVLGGQDNGQGISARDGLEIEGAFSGLTVFHDKYDPSISNQGTSILRINVSNCNNFSNQLNQPVVRNVAQFDQNIITSSVQLVVGYDYPLPTHYRYIDKIKFYGVFSCTGDFVGECKARFIMTDNTNIGTGENPVIPGFTYRFSDIYQSKQDGFFDIVQIIPYFVGINGAGDNMYSVYFEMNKIPIPAVARIGNLGVFITSHGANNLTNIPNPVNCTFYS